MNIQAINMKSTKRRRQAASKAGFAGKFYAVGVCLLIFGIVAFCFNYRTWLNRNIARIDKETSVYRSKIHELDREIEALRIRKESLCSWSHIQNKIAFFSLDLRLPNPSQTQRLVVSLDGVPADSQSPEVSDSKVAMVSRNQ